MLAATRSRFPLASFLTSTATAALLAACGGGDGADSADGAAATSTDATAVVAPPQRQSVSAVSSTAARAIALPSTAAPSPPAAFTLQQRSDAATRAARSSAFCVGLHPFYWEIGDKSGMQASGTGGGVASATPAPGANTVVHVASASKWLFSTYVVEKQQGVLSANDVKLLNFTSGHVSLDNCSLRSTVSSCLSEPGLGGGVNGAYTAAADGRFDYNGGHMQVHADQLGLGQKFGPGLTAPMQAVLGANVAFQFGVALIGGGANATPAAYAQFLRNLLAGKYPNMRNLLGSHAVCTHTNSADCPSALYNPINQSTPGGPNDVGNEASHYSLGHWVEDDPKNGDGAFSSPGGTSFYPWVDAGKTTYGVLATSDALTTTQTTPLPNTAWPVNCGRAIRRAWMAPDGAAALPKLTKG